MSASDEIICLESGQVAKNYWRDFWRHRELLLFLVWRDIIVRYKQTVIGTSWVLIRPFLTMLVFTFVFGKIANLSSGNVPYALVVFTGLLPWFFFSNALSEVSNSVIGNGHLISKVYFPRLIVPLGALIVAIVDFAVTFLMLFLVMLWFSFIPSWHIFFIFYFIALVILFSFGLGLWASALNVRFRDFRHLIPFALQLGVYVSPVGYISQIVPDKWRLLYSLNPMVGVIEGFRWAIIGGEFQIFWPSLFISTFTSIFLVVTGIWYFRKTEDTFADVI
ncbi:ABC transporter permease [Polynucleobacter paneuropaeus]|nr:ABC transporter permease [Polynucleobacter paneuropaeus]